MKFTSNDNNGIRSNSVNKPVFVGDATTPKPAQFIFKGFGFSYAIIWIFPDCLYKLHYTCINFFIGFFPRLKLRMSMRSKSHFSHSFFFLRPLPMFTVISSPLSACAIDSISIFRLAGLLSRYSVSSCSSSIMIEMCLFLKIILTALRKLSSISLALIWKVEYIIENLEAKVIRKIQIDLNLHEADYQQIRHSCGVRFFNLTH